MQIKEFVRIQEHKNRLPKWHSFTWGWVYRCGYVNGSRPGPLNSTKGPPRNDDSLCLQQKASKTMYVCSLANYFISFRFLEQNLLWASCTFHYSFNHKHYILSVFHLMLKRKYEDLSKTSSSQPSHNSTTRSVPGYKDQSKSSEGHQSKRLDVLKQVGLSHDRQQERKKHPQQILSYQVLSYPDKAHSYSMSSQTVCS